MPEISCAEWTALGPNEQEQRIAGLEQLATQRVAWFVNRAAYILSLAESAKNQHTTIWKTVVIINAVIALLNAASTIPPVSACIAAWIIPFTSVVLSLIISTLGVLRDHQKHEQVATLCDEVYNDLMAAEIDYQTEYMIKVHPQKPDYGAFVELGKLFHTLGNRQKNMSARISREFASLEKKTAGKAKAA